jgi:hypothetical protein
VFKTEQNLLTVHSIIRAQKEDTIAKLQADAHECSEAVNGLNWLKQKLGSLKLSRAGCHGAIVPTAGTRHSVQRLSVRFKTTVAHVNGRAKVLGVVAKRAQRLAYAERFSHSTPRPLGAANRVDDPEVLWRGPVLIAAVSPFLLCRAESRPRSRL